MSQREYTAYVGGRWVPASGSWLESYNPARADELVGCVQACDEAKVDEAVEAARSALPAWRSLAGPERSGYLGRAASLLEGRLEEIASLASREMGKPIGEARGEAKRGVTLLRYYAAEGYHSVGEVIPSTVSGQVLYTTRTPLGVVAVVTPWNFPIAIPLWKIAPALIYGNTVVFKPASAAAVTGAYLVDVFEEAGLPPGVLNMVAGSGSRVGTPLVANRHVTGISFTGSNAVGKEIARLSVERGVKYQLEMGGKNAVIVADDADLDLAVELTVSGAMRSAGQKCTATSRAIVCRTVYGDFKERLIARLQSIKVGDAMDDDTYVGPLVSRGQMEQVLQHIEIGKREAHLVLGGGRIEADPYGRGYFVEPTLFDGVTAEMHIAQEEIFGPVLGVMTVGDLAEAIRVANDVRFGLSSTLFTRDLRHAFTYIDQIEAGMVRVNVETAGVEPQAPFGGLKASSSHSREQGRAALDFFTDVKTVTIGS